MQATLDSVGRNERRLGERRMGERRIVAAAAAAADTARERSASEWNRPALLVRAVVALAVGAAALLWIGITLPTLTLLFGGWVIADGVLAIAATIAGKKRDGLSWPLLLEGVVGVAIGTLLLALPGIDALGLLMAVAAWAIATGILEVAAVARLRTKIRGEWMMALAGVASVAFGVLLAMFPTAAGIVLAWVVGAYALAFGALTLLLAMSLRARQRR